MLCFEDNVLTKALRGIILRVLPTMIIAFTNLLPKKADISLVHLKPLI